MPFHPFIVHFVIALYTMSLFLDLLEMKTQKEAHNALAHVTLITSGIFVVFSVVSGLFEDSRIAIPIIAKSAFEIHETAAFITASIILFLGLWRIGLRNKFTRRLKLLYLGVAFAGLISLYIGAYYGGRLVYEYGTGIRSDHRLTGPPKHRLDIKKPTENDLFYAPVDSIP